MTIKLEEGSSKTVPLPHPYSPSWLNRLLNWIDRQPGPAWLYYLIGIIFFGTLLFLALWMTEGSPIETEDLRALIFGTYPVYFIALMHYLDGEARSALAKFRPVLQVSDAEYAHVEYELTTVPAKGAWFLTALALLFGFFEFFTGGAFSHPQRSILIGSTILAFFSACVLAGFFIFAYRTFRQLRTVSKIHAAVPTINIFHASTVYAFSQLTARTGMGLMLFAYFDFVQNPPDPDQPLDLIMGVVLVLAVATFVLPLIGMHRRLVQEKGKVEADINRGVETVHRKVQERMVSADFASLEDLDKTLSILLSLREVVAKIPTWPWRAETLRSFISALLLPILVWVVTAILEQYLIF